MSAFIQAIRKEYEGLRKAQPCLGYIPAGGIDFVTNIAKVVRVPSSTLQTPDKGYLEYKEVPLPARIEGIFSAIQNVLGQDVGVMVGFKGGNQAFPYIINYVNIAHAVTTREDYKVGPNRSGALTDKLLSPGSPSMMGAISTPVPTVGEPMTSQTSMPPDPPPVKRLRPVPTLPNSDGTMESPYLPRNSDKSKTNILNRSQTLLNKSNQAHILYKELTGKLK